MKHNKLMDAAVFASIVEKYFGITEEKVSLVDICEKTGVNYDTAYERIRKGWDELEAVSTKSGKKIRKIPPLEKMKWGWNPDLNMFIDPDGEMFPSIRSMCYAHHVEESTVRLRLRRGIPLAKALSHERVSWDDGSMESEIVFGYDVKTGLYTVGNGVFFENIKTLCQNYQMPVMYYRQGCEHGFDRMDLALNHPQFPTEKQPMIIAGKEYTNLNQVCKENGLSVKSLCYQMITENKTIEEVLKDKKDTSYISYEEQRFGYSNWDGKFYCPGDPRSYNSFSDLCKNHAMAYATVARRICNGESLVEALRLDLQAAA